MRFQVISRSSHVPSEGRNIGFLLTDGWNDYWEFNTLYVLYYFDDAGIRHALGGIKIGQFAWQTGQERPQIPSDFSSLDDRFFSLGQDVSYYQEIASLGSSVSTQLLAALKDIVADPALFTRASEEEVTGTSLLRSVSAQSVQGQFKRVLDGGVVLTEYSFTYEGPKPTEGNVPRVQLEFQVNPDSKPPTNIHVVIGRNGVGKTFLLNGLTRSLVSSEKNENDDGIFRVREAFSTQTAESPFANIVSITFSAFDDFPLIPERRNALKGVRYSNIGLRQPIKTEGNETVVITRDPSDLASDFSKSAKVCLTGERTARWVRALTTLQADPIFEEAQVASLATVDESQFARHADQLFRKLSSGHKIVLLTITKLVEKVEEKSLVLMDEPEAHLHPPLLAAFIRALSDLLIDRNGVAIIATHSPVVLQEVPASCVWKIVRHGHAARADRPEIETFGENVGILTREVFGLEVTRSGFHQMLADAVGNSGGMDEILRKFNNQVGAEGRAHISSLIAARDSDGGS
jgi:predicted ATPase